MPAHPTIRVKRHPLEHAPPDYAGLAASSFFASPGFMNLWRTMKGRPVAHVAEADARVVAAIPGIEYGSGPATRFASMSDGWAGGIVTAKGVARATVVTPLLDHLIKTRYAKIAIFDPHASTAEHAALTAEPYEILQGDITGPDWSPPDATLRKEIRSAQRQGLEIQRFAWSRHGAGFLELVAATARRHGERPRYPAALFQRFAELADIDDRVIWKYAERDANPVASQIYVLEGTTLVAWYECFDKRYASLKPHQLMRVEACREAETRGATTLDLGVTRAGATGVLAYKRHWGVEPVTRVCQLRWAGLGRIARGVKGLAAIAPGWTRGR